jgi:hypothetical protein
MPYIKELVSNLGMGLGGYFAGFMEEQRPNLGHAGHNLSNRDRRWP